MRLVALLVLLAACATASAAPNPKVSLSIASRVAATDLWVIYTVSATAGPDSLIVTTSGSGQTAVRRKYLGSTTDSVKFTRPLPSLTISGSVAAFAVRRGLPSATASKPWTYTEPDVPPPAPTLDTLIVRPGTLSSMPVGVTKQLCAIHVWSNGATGLDVVQDTIPACLEQLAAYRMGLSSERVTGTAWDYYLDHPMPTEVASAILESVKRAR